MGRAVYMGRTVTKESARCTRGGSNKGREGVGVLGEGSNKRRNV